MATDSSSTVIGNLSAGRMHTESEDAPATIVQVEQSAGGATITYGHQDNILSEVFLFPEDLEGLSVSDPALSTPFTGDPREFRVAAEALRIRTAGLHDPMSEVVPAMAAGPLTMTMGTRRRWQGVTSQNRRQLLRHFPLPLETAPSLFMRIDDGISSTTSSWLPKAQGWNLRSM